MNFTVNEITNSIAGKPSLSECSVDELRQLASHYPFFGPAQFLFVKKLKEENSWQLKEQVRKASLYFQNPLWFNHLLNTTADTPVANSSIKEEFIIAPAAEMEIPAKQEEVVENYLLNATADTPVANSSIKEEFIIAPAAEMEIPVKQEEVVDNYLLNATAGAPVAIATKNEELITEPAAEMEIPVKQEEVVDNYLLNTTAGAPVAIATKNEEFITEPAAEMEIPEMQEEVDDNNLLNTLADIPVAIATKNEEFIAEPAAEMENPVTQEEVVENYLQNATAEAPVAIPIKKEDFIPEPAAEMEIPFTHEEVVDQTRFARQPELAHAVGQAEPFQPELLVEMPKFKFEPVDMSKTQFTFEPYHTIDYFASQGIRPAAEEKPKDQFSRQLKSFTEWLKVMKKLPVTEIAAAVSAVDEKKVEKMAELSINDREVVTEAMAEVWEKQGNLPKAREIYEKLSLLNPDKSAYFAAKIDQLKNL